jgi:uncharacterized membrane protein YfcA
MAIAIYGGYFGGGIGFLMLAALTVFGVEDVRAANALRNALAAALNGVAVVAFITSGRVAWVPTLVVMAGAVLGGLAGVAITRRIPAPVLRGIIISAGLAFSVYFLLR